MAAQIDKNMMKIRPAKAVGRVLSWALIEGRPLTTRGRWINTLVFKLLALCQYLPTLKTAKFPIYIVGTGRSGTTVLGQILALHRQLQFLNEPKAIWHYAIGDEDLIGSYSSSHATVRIEPHVAGKEEQSRLLKAYSWALRLGRAKRVVDKYPELIFRVPFVLRLMPNARLIALVRNGVDSCSSVNNWIDRNKIEHADETHDWWGRNDRKWNLLVDQIVPEHADLAPYHRELRSCRNHHDRAAVEWIVSMREVLAATENHSEVMLLKYEELCNHPIDQLRAVARHCSLPPDEKMEEYARITLSEAAPYCDLALQPFLVEPFRETLKRLGYGDSAARVRPRD